MILETAEFSSSMLLGFVFTTCIGIFTLPAIASTFLVLRDWRRDDEARGIEHHGRPLADIIHLPRRRKAA